MPEKASLDALFSADQPPSGESSEPTTDTEDQPLDQDDQPTTDDSDTDDDGAPEKDEDESDEDDSEDESEGGEDEPAETEHAEASETKSAKYYQHESQLAKAQVKKLQADYDALKAQITIDRMSKPTEDGQTMLDELASNPAEAFRKQRELARAEMRLENQINQEMAQLEAYAKETKQEAELDEFKLVFSSEHNPGFAWSPAHSPQTRAEILKTLLLGRAAQNAADKAMKNGIKQGKEIQKQRMKEVSAAGGASAPLKSGKNVDKAPPESPQEAEWDEIDARRAKRKGLDRVF